MQARTLAPVFAALTLAGCSAASTPPAPGFAGGSVLTQDLSVTHDLSHFTPSDMRRGMQEDLAGTAPEIDMLPPPNDLASTTPADLAGNTQDGIYGCDSLSYCYGTCYYYTVTAQDFIDCVSIECDPHGTTNAQSLLSAAFQCSQDYCEGKKGDPARCSSASDNSDDCIACINNADDKLLFLACDDPTDPACNNSACHSAVVSCHNSHP
jgi:hypothetical protein